MARTTATAFAAIALAACGGSARTAAPSGAGGAGAAAVAAAAAAGPPPLVHAPPPAMMELVALTADGSAAFTGDADGDGRLWPALDGSVEPVAVDLPAARAAAIARAGDGFGIAVVDDAGGLVVEALDRDGRRIARAAIAPDPVVRDVVAVDAGVVIRRADHSVALLDWRGRQLARLAANPGEQLTGLAGNGHAAIVAVSRGKQAELRRIAIAGSALAWGDAIAHRTGDLVALSPSGDRTAVAHTRGPAAGVVVADRHGNVAEAALAGVTAIGFLDDDHLVAYDAAQIKFVAMNGSVTGHALPNEDEGHAVAGGVAVTALDSDLAVSTLRDDHFVGYGVAGRPSVVAAGTGGTVMIDAPDGSMLLDRALAPIPGRGLAIDDMRAILLAHLAGDDWLVATAAGDRLEPPFYVARGSAAIELPAHVFDPVQVALAFEPSTNLFAANSSESRRAFRYDPDAHVLHAEPALVPHPDDPGHHVTMIPVAPQLAGGIRVVTVEHGDTTTVRWFHDDAEQELAATVRVVAVLAVDRAGRAYVIDENGATVDVYDRDRNRLGALPRRGTTMVVVPDRDGTRVAQVAEDGVYVDAIAGKPVWHSPVISWQPPVWLDDGALAVSTPTGLVRLDGRTGAVLAMRCGWRFERAAKPHRQPPVGTTMCERSLRGENPFPPPLRGRGNLDD